jgi:hypothetical protein
MKESTVQTMPVEFRDVAIGRVFEFASNPGPRYVKTGEKRYRPEKSSYGFTLANTRTLVMEV